MSCISEVGGFTLIFYINKGLSDFCGVKNLNFQVMMTLHFLNDVANDAESTQKSNITS